MSDEETRSTDPFDLKKLKMLFKLMEQHDVTSVDLQGENQRWRLQRGAGDGVTMVPAYHTSAAMPVAGIPAASASDAGGEAAADSGDGGQTINSPTVGTFYEAPSPDDPPFVKIGARVEPDTIVCIVEAMKVFNQIPAEIGGTITEILVKNGDAVEFGQPLFRVKVN